MAAAMRAAAREVVAADRTRERATAVAADVRYGTVLSSRVTVSDGDYGDLAGAGLVMITAGVNEKAGGATDPIPGSSPGTGCSRHVERPPGHGPGAGCGCAGQARA